MDTMHGPKDLNASNERIRHNLSRIRNIVMVMSGKGGVGKSTVSTNLAWQLAASGKNVGIMDIDIHGPNIPKMLGIDRQVLEGTEEAIAPVRVTDNLHAASIGLAGYSEDQALIWRGPIKVGLIRQFLGDVTWGELDFLIIDTPPGTGDETLTVAQLVPTMAGTVIVTSPQAVSVLDSRKSIDFAKKLNIPILGLVENMSGFVCPHCGEITEIFSKGGGEQAAAETEIPFLGRVPLEAGVVESGDSGLPVSGRLPDSAAARALANIGAALEKQILTYRAQGRYDGAQRKLDEVLSPKKPATDFRPER